MAAFGFNVLEKFDEADGSVTALLHCRPGTDRADYCVAYGFDEADGSWSYGKYTNNLAYAYDMANPDVIEEATVRWNWEDLAYAHSDYPIMDAPYEEHQQIIAELKKECGAEAIKTLKQWKDSAISQGNEQLASIERLTSILEAREAEREAFQEQRSSLKDEGRDAKGSSDALASKMADRAQTLGIDRKAITDHVTVASL